MQEACWKREIRNLAKDFFATLPNGERISKEKEKEAVSIANKFIHETECETVGDNKAMYNHCYKKMKPLIMQKCAWR